MENQVFNCSKCNGIMTRGFIVDRGSAYFPAYWVEGEPIHSELFGIQGANLDISGKKMYMLRSLRCEKCGFTELYSV